MDSMDTSEIFIDVLPQTWELQSLRKSFKGRTVDVLPEAWELRNFPKPSRGCCKKDMGDAQMELVMLLAIRCMQRSEIEDFSISYQADIYPNFILTYTTKGNTSDEKRLKLLVTYVLDDTENKRIFKPELIEFFLHLLHDSDSFDNVIFYTNMEWKRKNPVLEKINFQATKANEEYSELERICIIDNCYGIAGLRRQIEEQCPTNLEELLDESAFNRFVLAAEQPHKQNMRAEFQKRSEEEYNLNSERSAKLAEFVYDYFFKVHPWWKEEVFKLKKNLKRKRKKLNAWIKENVYMKQHPWLRMDRKARKKLPMVEETLVTKGSFVRIVEEGLLCL